jgi:hypothetical protein
VRRAEKRPKNRASRGRRKAENGARADLVRPLATAAKDYHEHSRTLALSFLLVIPLLVIYEVGIALLRSPVASGARMEVRLLFDLAFGTRSALVFNGAILASFLAAFLYLKWRGRVRLDLFPAIVLESTLYAVALGYGVSALTAQFPLNASAGGSADGAALSVVLSIGAGVYEELIFRLALMSALYAIGLLIAPQGGKVITPVIVLLSALIFSGCHHLGMGGEPFRPYDFLFRFLFGIALSAIYMFRGLGVAVYTHAIYDILVTLRFGL